MSIASVQLEAVDAARGDAAKVAVEVVDCDVHPYPSPTNSYLIAENTPEPWRSRFFAKGHRYKHGGSIIFDPPSYASSQSKREDSRPPGGGFPCSDPDFALKHLIREAKVDIAILEPMVRAEIVPQAELARCIGYNGWLAEGWLGSATNGHERWRGSICVTLEDPEGSAREIERWAGHPMMVQALITPEVRFGFGDPRCDPLYAAAARHNLPVAVHVGRGPDDRLPLTPVGPGSWYLDIFTMAPMLYAAHLTSLVFDGAFERHPNLKIMLVEGGFSWALPLMWRLDAYWRARRADLPEVKRPPSEYILEHVRFTTQPIEDPEDRTDITRFLSWMDTDKLLLFSTDYPHWSYDDPAWAVQRIPKDRRDRVMFQNAIDLLGLPTTVPALAAERV
jgi:predicted TIM-barrel fold metal-dependent hydrolase